MKLIGVLLFGVYVCAYAQTQNASITGVLLDPDNGRVAKAPVQIKEATGKISQTVSSGEGQYTFRPLVAGTYEISLPFPCCTYAATVVKDVKLLPGQQLRLDLHIGWGTNLGTLGDDPLTRLDEIRGGVTIPSGPAPKTFDGHPDLSGVWLPEPKPNQPPAPLQPWAAALFKKRTDDNNKDYPANFCLPGNPMSFSLNFPYQIVQAPKMMVILQELVPQTSRQIFLDGREHPKDPNPTWMGHSVAKWEGDVLVIDSVGFNDKTWLSNFGIPHTQKMHTIERVRRPDFGHLEVEILIEDPGAFTAAWKRVVGATLAPKKDEEILEYICNENNKDAGHLVGK